ncbi:MAG: hypothetical protein UU98_C0035G0002 [Parcubacteria group bacterium GW2011_GWD2_42_14]|nr:MAG: hypothetical protein UU98_C0035G0002 [Parcubacteria group bacterium GW2011_GWD2_42_14]
MQCMFGFHEKRKFKSFLYSKAFLVFMCIPIGLMSYAAYNAYERERETNMLRQELANELVALEKRSGELEKNIENLEDPRGIEFELRSRYDVGWEGEEVIILVEDETSTQTLPVLPESKTNVWHRFIDVLF